MLIVIEIRRDPYAFYFDGQSSFYFHVRFSRKLESFS